MDKKKKILIALIIIDIIIFAIAVLLTIKLIKTNENESNLQNKVENKVENVIENTVANNTIENEITNTKSNNIEHNEQEENNNADVIKQVADPEQEIDKNTLQKQQSNQEKAINIAKEKWGQDNSVEFTFDHIDENGRYVIFVRDIETTRQIDEYVIDIQTGNIVQ